MNGMNPFICSYFSTRVFVLFCHVEKEFVREKVIKSQRADAYARKLCSNVSNNDKNWLYKVGLLLFVETLFVSPAIREKINSETVCHMPTNFCARWLHPTMRPYNYIIVFPETAILKWPLRKAKKNTIKQPDRKNVSTWDVTLLLWSTLVTLGKLSTLNGGCITDADCDGCINAGYAG